MRFLQTVSNLLEHIKEVELDTIALTKKAQMQLTAVIERHGITLDDETFEALQYQDIIAQQLSATIEAIESVQENLSHFNAVIRENETIGIERLEKMDMELSSALVRAKEKRDAFAGKTRGDHNDDDEGIEFF